MKSPQSKQNRFDSPDALEVCELTTIFRSICLQLGYTRLIDLESLVDKYIRKTVSDPSKVGSQKGNFKKALLGPKMTYETFSKAIDMLCADNFKITVSVARGGETYTTSVVKNSKPIPVDKSKIRKRR